MHRLARAAFQRHVHCRFFTTTTSTSKVKQLVCLNSNNYFRFLARRGFDHPSPTPVDALENSADLDEGDYLRTKCEGTLSQVTGNFNHNEMKNLPPELSRSTVKLTCESTVGGICDVYLVGTAHVSRESCQEVQDVINFLKPQAVFLELCSNRRSILKRQTLKVPTTREMLKMLRKNENPFAIIYSWFLAKVADKLGVLPGAEFRVAYEEAMKYGGKVVLGDRPVQITLQRTWAKMPVWHKTKLLSSLLLQPFFLPSSENLNMQLKQMDDVDKLTSVIQGLGNQFPTLLETLVNERDQYMSAKLLKCASKHSSVVAVVGKGHLAGIQKYWKQPIEVKPLMEVPLKRKKSPLSKIIKVAGIAAIGGIYLSSRK